VATRPANREDARMPTSDGPQVDRRKVRLGLAVITAVVVVALVLAFVVDSSVGRAIMFAIALLGIVRAFLLSRSLRADA
jgi:hypothetical protein